MVCKSQTTPCWTCSALCSVWYYMKYTWRDRTKPQWYLNLPSTCTSTTERVDAYIKRKSGKWWLKQLMLWVTDRKGLRPWVRPLTLHGCHIMADSALWPWLPDKLGYAKTFLHFIGSVHELCTKKNKIESNLNNALCLVAYPSPTITALSWWHSSSTCYISSVAFSRFCIAASFSWCVCVFFPVSYSGGETLLSLVKVKGFYF